MKSNKLIIIFLILAAVFSHVSADIIAYNAGVSLKGNSSFNGVFGLDFDVDSAIFVTGVGAFDHLANGISRNIYVSIFERTGTGSSATGSLIYSGVVTGNSNYEAGYQFLDFSYGLLLDTGSYTISAQNFGNGDPSGNAADGNIGPRYTNGGDGLVSFVQSRWSYPSPLFPENAGEWGSGDNYVQGYSFLAANFKYVAVPEPSSIILTGLGLFILVGLRRKLKK